ncbi:MAG: type I-E CRISPR-associated protein Cse2/CasB [Burkholderiaceae bacterium]
MSERAEQFIGHLMVLKEKDSGAMAVLRHSLAFEPGNYPRAFAYVERFAGAATHEHDGWRLALYAVAGLFASHPSSMPRSFAAAFGELMRLRSKPNEPNKSIEGRFMAILGADAENIADYLRQAVSLLAAKDMGFDYVRLLDDLAVWMNGNTDPAWRDRKRQLWARDFYQSAQVAAESTDADSKED